MGLETLLPLSSPEKLTGDHAVASRRCALPWAPEKCPPPLLLAEVHPRNIRQVDLNTSLVAGQSYPISHGRCDRLRTLAFALLHNRRMLLGRQREEVRGPEVAKSSSVELSTCTYTIASVMIGMAVSCLVLLARTAGRKTNLMTA